MLKIILLIIFINYFINAVILEENSDSKIGEINKISVSPNSKLLVINDVGNKQIKIYNLYTGVLFDKIEINNYYSDSIYNYLVERNRKISYINIINEKIDLVHSKDFINKGISDYSYSTNMNVDFLTDSIIIFSVNVGSFCKKTVDNENKYIISPLSSVFKYNIKTKKVSLFAYTNAYFNYKSFANVHSDIVSCFSNKCYIESINTLLNYEHYDNNIKNYPIVSEIVSDTSLKPIIYLPVEYIKYGLNYDYSNPRFSILNKNDIYHTFGLIPFVYLNNKKYFEIYIKSDNNKINLDNIFQNKQVNTKDMQYFLDNIFVEKNYIYIVLKTSEDFNKKKYSNKIYLQKYSIENKVLITQKEFKTNDIKQINYDRSNKRFVYVFLNKNEDYEIKYFSF